MLHIAICEDQFESLKYIEDQISSQLSLHDHKYHIDLFQNSQSLLNTLDTPSTYDALFLDIEMPKLSGLELAQKIREFDQTIVIIFVSNREDKVYDTFEIAPFRFIRKSHFSKEIPKVISDLITYLEKGKSLKMTFKDRFSQKYYHLDIYNIQYIESMGKKCKIVFIQPPHTLLTFHYKISDFTHQLEAHSFVQPHRSFLVNVKSIFSIQKDHLLLDDQTIIPLSRSREKAVQTTFLDLTLGAFDD